MEKQKAIRQLIPVLRSSVATLREHKAIFFPFIIVAFLQLLTLEILYFAPRDPLNIIFGPIISRLWPESSFLHYPSFFLLLPKLFYWATVPISLFVSSFCSAMATKAIFEINHGRRANMKRIFKECLPLYLHCVILSFITFFIFFLYTEMYQIITDRALEIKSQSGVFFFIKTIVIKGGTYFSLIFDVFITALLIYVIPVLVHDKRKIFGAIIDNFRVLKGAFWFSFLIILIPALLYLPVLMLRNSYAGAYSFPELTVWLLILSIFMMALIEAIIFTSAATFYLLKKEGS